MKTKKILSLLLASILLLGLITIPTSAADAATDTYARSEATALLKAPTINGSISTGEWGDPMIVTNSDHALDTWGEKGHSIKDNVNYDPAQLAKVWLTNDNNFIYLAVTLDHETAGTKFFGSDNKNYPQMSVLLSQKGSDKSPVLVDGKDQYTKLTIGFRDENGKAVASLKGRTLANFTPTVTNDAATWTALGFNYNVKFENNTYTYEVKIPFEMTNISLEESNDIVMSIHLGSSHHGLTDADPNNQYNIGGSGALDADKEKANAQGKCMNIKLREACYAKNAATELLSVPTINGSVSTDEWGDPIIVTNSAYADATWGTSGYLDKDTVNYNPEQLAKVWLTNDNNFIYLAVTLDHETAGTKFFGTDNKNYPQMSVLLSQKGADNSPVLAANGFDQYTKLTIGFKADNNGNPVPSNTGKTFANFTPTVTDTYAAWMAAGFNCYVKHANDTYTYEVKIPFEMTNISLEESNDIVMSIHLGASHYGTTDAVENNQYNIGSASARYASPTTSYAQGKCMNMTLNEYQRNVQVGNKYYATLQAALAAATSGQTVTLLADATVDQWADEVGITLDLNGYVLTANKISAVTPYSTVKDSKDGVGGIKIAKNDENATNLTLNPSNPQLPLYDSKFNGYRFYNCTTTQLNTTSGTCKFGFRFDFTNKDAYDLLADAANADMKLETSLLVKIDEKEPVELTYRFNPTTLASYANEKKTNPDTNWAIILTVNGFDRLNGDAISMTSTPSIQSSTGVRIVPANNATATYTYK